MKNKVYLKKCIIVSIIVIILWSAIFGIFYFYQFKSYTSNFNKKIESIIEEVTEKYPDIETVELVEILNTNKSSSNEILKTYGIDLEEDSVVKENEQNFKIFIKANLFIILLLAFSLLLIFRKYNKEKEEQINEITKYIEEINRKNYKLNIEDNTEDELSILKNEIYKITVMLKEQAENSMKDKLNLKSSISDISHQIKTPLTSISIMLDNIIENPNMDEFTRNEFIKTIKRETMNINFLVQALLKLAKFDTNTVNFINREVKVDDILNEAIRNVSTLCDLKNIHIDVIGNSNDSLICDLKWQVEAISNILKNSVEYSNENSDIEIIHKENKLFVTIKIIDNGKGIEKEELPHIFERFFKGKNSSNGSIGIGLALSKAIIEKNNGKISVESKVNEGTIFTIKYFK